MKRFFYFLMLIWSMSQISFAQTKEADWFSKPQTPVGIPPLVPEDRRVIIPLENGNKVIIGLQNNEDLLRYRNVDSLLAIFLKDYEQIKDTLQSPVESFKIHYRLNGNQRNVQVWRYPMTSTQIQLQSDENILVKVVQDSIVIEQTFPILLPGLLKKVQQTSKDNVQKEPLTINGQFRIYFLVNSLNDLERIIQEKLNPKVEKLIADMQGWPKRSVFNTSIWASQVQYTGMTTPAIIKVNQQLKPDHIVITPRLGTGLVGNAFMPSVGATVIYLPHIRYRTGKLSGATQNDGFLLGWERFFTFDRDMENRLVIRSNDFISAGIALFKPGSDSKPYGINRNVQWAEVKVSYLIRQQGDAFRPNTFRISTAFSPYVSVRGLQRLRLEPELYFNDFFRHVYPGLRLTLGF